jgi:nuclear pore complex protein Nup53
MPVDAPTALDDTWVTAYGFPSEDLALVLREFQRCGDVLQWGTFGAGPGANFVHIQYQTRYGAQRALLKGGEQLSSTLIVGVKPLDARHRQQVEAAGGGPAAGGSPDGLRIGRGSGLAAAAAARPYRVEAAAAAALPQRGTGLWDKLQQFVIGV